jgi:hypothetical protein
MIRSDEQPWGMPAPQAELYEAVRALGPVVSGSWLLVETEFSVCLYRADPGLDELGCSGWSIQGGPPRASSSHWVEPLHIYFVGEAQDSFSLWRWSPWHLNWTALSLLFEGSQPARPLVHVYSPDNTHLAVRAALDRLNVRDLYVMAGLSTDFPILRRVNLGLGPAVEVDSGFVWASDSRRLLFRTGPDDPAAYLVDTSSTSTPTPARVDLPLAPGRREIQAVGFDPQANFVWYWPGAPGPNGLVLRRLNGLNLGPELVARPTTVSSTVPLVRHHFSADGRSLLTAHATHTGDLLHVYDLSGGSVGPARLVRGLPRGGRLGEVRQPRDGSRVLFTYGPADPPERQLYLVELRAPTVVATHLGPPPIPGASVKLVDVTISR